MFNLPSLPYDYSDLEPYLDSETMHLHHEKHHAAYTKNLNDALAVHPEFKVDSAESLLSDIDSVPEDIRTKVRNHGGGFVNHNLFWSVMSPRSSVPEGDLKTALEAAFGSLDDFKTKFVAAAISQFGSGWAWLVSDKGQLKITSTSNQDSPLSLGQIPLLTVDVWEHAYYLKYQNRRPEYLEAWWHVVNWSQVSQTFSQIK